MEPKIKGKAFNYITHSLRSATVDALEAALRVPVSIHALLAECDASGR